MIRNREREKGERKEGCEWVGRIRGREGAEGGKW